MYIFYDCRIKKGYEMSDNQLWILIGVGLFFAIFGSYFDKIQGRKNNEKDYR